jgi:hypothetical protein
MDEPQYVTLIAVGLFTGFQGSRGCGLGVEYFVVYAPIRLSWFLPSSCRVRDYFAMRGLRG